MERMQDLYGRTINQRGWSMDAQMIRRGLEETREQLARIEEEREVLRSLEQGFEGWLRLHEPSVPMDKGAVSATKPEGGARFRTKGDIPYVDAIRQALKEADGESMTLDAIAKRAHELGARSHSKDELGVIDTLAKRMGAVRGDAPKTWRMGPTPS